MLYLLPDISFLFSLIILNWREINLSWALCLDSIVRTILNLIYKERIKKKKKQNRAQKLIVNMYLSSFVITLSNSPQSNSQTRNRSTFYSRNISVISLWNRNLRRFFFQKIKKMIDKVTFEQHWQYHQKTQCLSLKVEFHLVEE